MTAVKVIVACASALVLAVVGLAACGASTTRTGYVSTPTFAPTTSAPTSTLQAAGSVAKTTTRSAARPVAPVVPAARPAAPVVIAPHPVVVRPAPVTPGRPSAVCKDGTLSYSVHGSGTCSGHHGVARWL